MTPLKIEGIIATLREQVEKDSALDPVHFEFRLAASYALLDQLAGLRGLPSGAQLQIPQVKRSLREFYSGDGSREWVQKFALNDLQILEEVSKPKNRA